MKEKPLMQNPAASAEEELKRSHERYELAVRGTNDGIWDWDLLSNTLYLSPRWKEQLGYGDEELENSMETFNTLLHPDDLDRVNAFLERYLRGEIERYEIEFRMRHKDGSDHWMLARAEAFRDERGIPVRMAGSHSDITSRREAEQRFERLFRGNPALMAISSVPDRRFVDVNEAFLKTLGFTREEIIGRTVAELDLIPDIDEQRHMADKLQRDGRIDGFEMRTRRKDGSILTGLFSGELMTTQGRQYFLTVMVDMTEGKKAQQELEKSNRRLEKAIEKANDLAIRAQIASIAKSEFLANMSHEIRTPMNGVIGMTGLLLDTPLDEDQRRYAEILRNSGETLLSLINDILDFSKIEARKLKLEEHEFDLQVLLGEITASMRHRAEEKGLGLSCVINPEVPLLLRGDPGRLRQILTNLLSNAVKFTRAGQVAIHVDLLPDAPHSQPLNPSTPKPLNLLTSQPVPLRFSIRDTGIGIPADKIPLLFDKFSQVDASTTRQYGGTGLGLAISKQLVELMGGEIGVLSPSELAGSVIGGPGAEFWFTVYLQQQENPQIHPGPDKAGTAGPGVLPLVLGREIRLLLAEDNPTNQQVALGILKKFGVRVDLVATGSEALSALSKNDYDLVLMDVQMPEMDGLVATRLIRQKERSQPLNPFPPQPINPSTSQPPSPSPPAHIPIIAMTAHVMQGDRERCLEAGMDDYLAKPVSPQALMQKLQHWLSIARIGEGGREGPAAVVPDWDRADLMRRLMDDIPLATRVIAGFLEDLPKQIDRLEEALQNQDWVVFRRQAHTIKGASANLGARRLQLRAEALEAEAQDGIATELERGVIDVRRAFQALRRVMAPDGEDLR